MKTDIILAGVGGQGILSIAAVIGLAAVNNDLNLKQAEVHGMSQRGGAVYSHLRLSDQPIASDLIPLGMANVVLSVEPMEALRYMPYMAPDGWLVTNTRPFVNIDNYPNQQILIEQLNALKNKVLVEVVVPDIDQKFNVYLSINKKIGNVIMLLNKAINDLDENFEPKKNNSLYNRETGERYKPNTLIYNTNIRNGTTLILI